MSLGYEYLFKFVIIGDSGVGKSCILVRFADDTYDGNYISTIGVDFKTKSMESNGKPVKLMIFDTAGQERFRTITSSYYRGAQGVMIVFDVTNRESFDHVRFWLTEIERYCKPNVQVCLIGSKSDSEDRQISYDEGQKLARELNLPYIETSAKTSYNIDQAFSMMTTLAQERVSNRVMQQKSTESVMPTQTRKVQLPASRCC